MIVVWNALCRCSALRMLLEGLWGGECESTHIVRRIVRTFRRIVRKRTPALPCDTCESTHTAIGGGCGK